MTTANRPLKFADHLFLLLDKKSQPMQVIGICVFELPSHINNPSDETAFFAPIIHAIKNKQAIPYYPFNQQLKNKLYWQTDNDYKPDRHFFEHALTAPNNHLDDLGDFCATLIQELLPKNAPLWQLHLVKNIAPTQPTKPNRFAICLKVHHCVADGVALMRLIHAGLSPNPNDNKGFPFFQKIDKPKKPSHHHQKPSLSELAKTGIQNTLSVGSALKERFGGQTHGFTSPFDTPASILNQAIDNSRQVVLKTLDKARFEKLAQRFDTSTNNIILAVCSSALRAYLLAQNALPTKPLITLVPISLRKDDSDFGNQLSFLLANLGTNKTEPKERLATIIDSVNDSKARFDKLTPAQVILYSAMIYGSTMANLMTGLAPKTQGFNLLISNIPNKYDEHYLNGAKLTNIYPASVLFNGQAMNITFSNFKNSIDFGITVCPSVLKGVDALPDLLENALAELENTQ